MLAHQWSEILVMVNYTTAVIKTLVEILPVGTTNRDGHDVPSNEDRHGCGVEKDSPHIYL